MAREVEDLKFDTSGIITLGGSANSYTARTARRIRGYNQGFSIRAKVNVTSTGTSTLNVNDIDDVTIHKIGGDPIGADDLIADSIYDFIFQGTYWQVPQLVGAEVDLMLSPSGDLMFSPSGDPIIS